MGVMEDVKKLREFTSLGIMDCKKALEEAQGDFQRALDLLKARGIQIAHKKSQRIAKEGLVESYIHLGSKIGSMVELSCETDFVARTDEVKKFARDICMQIAATDPLYIKKEEVPSEVLQKYIAGTGETEEDFYKKHCLLEQEFIKDSSLTVQDYLTSLVSKIGENILIKKFVRFEVGKD